MTGDDPRQRPAPDHAPIAGRLRARAQRVPEWNARYDAFVARLHALGVGDAAPGAGATFPPLRLPDQRGRYRSIAEIAGQRPIVVSFQRGGWCPYCRIELAAWRGYVPDVEALGARFVAITPETAGRAQALSNLLAGRAHVLCDVDFGAALGLGLAFYAGEELMRAYRDNGVDFTALYGADSGILPIPATYLLDREGVVRYAFVDPDLRRRAEPEDVLAALRALG